MLTAFELKQLTGGALDEESARDEDTQDAQDAIARGSVLFELELKSPLLGGLFIFIGSFFV
jgi:hypothetical protein